MSSQGDWPAIGDYALIGDCRTAALISRRGSIDWCCLPRFDSGSAFARLLDRSRGGHCSFGPEERDAWETTRRYLDDTLVLETTFESPSGELKLFDCMLMGEHARDVRERRILRVIEGRQGTVATGPSAKW